MLLHVLQAIDPRTRMVLFKMLNRGVFHDINGCISTGKEVCTHYSQHNNFPPCYLFDCLCILHLILFNSIYICQQNTMKIK